MDKDQAAFHLEEYKQLRTEVASLLARIEALFRYSIVVAATVFAWLLSNSLGAVTVHQACLKIPREIAQLAWLLPPAFILFAGLMAFVAIYRVNQMGDYLGKLEMALGNVFLGWEDFLRPKSRVMTWSTGAIWGLLFVCTIAFSDVGTHATNEACTVCVPAKDK